MKHASEHHGGVPATLRPSDGSVAPSSAAAGDRSDYRPPETPDGGLAVHAHDIQRIRESHAALGDPQRFGQRFYAVLFALRPQSRQLFTADIDAQVTKLMDMINAIVAGLDAPAQLQQDFAELGRRHAGYGVSEDDYDDVGAALLIALRDCLGSRFTIETEQAWASIYGNMAETMIAAHNRARDA